MTVTVDPQYARRSKRRAKGRIRPTAEELESTLGSAMFDVALQPTAVARASDPDTSHQAAAIVKDLTARQTAVLECFRLCGPLADHDLVLAYTQGVVAGQWPGQSASGLRTRRCELGDKTPPLIVSTGEKVDTPGGGHATVWKAT